MEKVTLRHLAEQLGLSKFAVSRALAGKSGVSEETRRQVAAAAERLGYARPAPRQASHDIGLVFHDHDPANSELHMQIQNGIEREAHRLRRPVRLQRTHMPGQIADLARTSAGLLLVGPHDRATVEMVRTLGVPVVRLGWVDPLEPVDHVGGTDREGGQAVAGYLIERGHVSIAYVHGGGNYRGRAERFYGAREMVERHPHVTLHHMRCDETDPFAAALARLERAGIVPSAFFCSNDGLGVTVISELLGRGFRIPDQVSVVGYGDFAAATQVAPQLTTVKVEGAAMGAAALRLVLERIEFGRAHEEPPRRVLIASHIVERRSTGPGPAARGS